MLNDPEVLQPSAESTGMDWPGKKSEALRQQIEAEPALTEKEWLLEQVGKIVRPPFGKI